MKNMETSENMYNCELAMHSIFKKMYLNNEELYDLASKESQNLETMIKKNIHNGNIDKINTLFFNGKIKIKNKKIYDYKLDKNEPNYFNMLHFLDINSLILEKAIFSNMSDNMKKQFAHMILNQYFVLTESKLEKPDIEILLTSYMFFKKKNPRDIFDTIKNYSSVKYNNKILTNIDKNIKDFFVNNLCKYGREKDYHDVIKDILSFFGFKEELFNNTEYLKCYHFFDNLYVLFDKNDYSDKEKMFNYYKLVAIFFGDTHNVRDELTKTNIRHLFFYGLGAAKKEYIDNLIEVLGYNKDNDFFYVAFEKIFSENMIPEEKEKIIRFFINSYEKQNISDVLYSLINQQIEKKENKDTEMLISLQSEFIEKNREHLSLIITVSSNKDEVKNIRL